VWKPLLQLSQSRYGVVEPQLWDVHTEDPRAGDNFDENFALAFTYCRLEDRLVILQRRVASLSRAVHDLTRLQSLRAKRPTSQPPKPVPLPSTEIGFVPSITARQTPALSPAHGPTAADPLLQYGIR
jgi:hypothetical protein